MIERVGLGWEMRTSGRKVRIDVARNDEDQ